MFWKIYFLIYTIITVLALFTLSLSIGMTKYSLGDVLSLVTDVLIFLALFSIAFKKKVFPPEVWKVIFIIFCLIALIGIISLIVPLDQIMDLPFLKTTSSSSSSTAVTLIALLLISPAYYAMYLLGFKKGTLPKKV